MGYDGLTCKLVQLDDGAFRGRVFRAGGAIACVDLVEPFGEGRSSRSNVRAPRDPPSPCTCSRRLSLPAAWAELDEFEGPEYRRVIVPVWSGADPATRHLMTVANLYEAADE